MLNITSTLHNSIYTFTSVKSDLKNKTFMKTFQNNNGRSSGDDSFNILTDFDKASFWIQVISITLSFVGNMLVIYATTRLPRLTLSKLVINYLAICDLTYSFIQVLLVHRKFYEHRWYFGSLLCTLSVLSPCALTTSLFVIAFISFERHRSILYPFRARYSKCRISFYVLFMWLVSCTLQLPYFMKTTVVKFYGKIDCMCIWFDDSKRYWDLSVFLLTYPVPLLIFFVCYFRIFWRVTKRCQFASLLQNKVNTKHNKLCVTLVTIIFAFVLTTSPNQVLILWIGFGDKTGSNAKLTYAILYSLSSLVHLHSFLNPIIYSISDQKFRRAFYCSFSGYKNVEISLKKIKEKESYEIKKQYVPKHENCRFLSTQNTCERGMNFKREYCFNKQSFTNTCATKEMRLDDVIQESIV